MADENTQALAKRVSNLEAALDDAIARLRVCAKHGGNAEWAIDTMEKAIRAKAAEASP